MGHLGAIAEADPKRLAEYEKQYPEVKTYADFNDAIAARYEGYTVATPAPTHFGIAEKIIKAGLDVMVEKPMTLSATDSQQLVNLAKEHGVTLMVGHLLLFHPAYRKIKELIDKDKIGKLYYLYSTRLNLGTVRTAENVFWSFAPHDISVLDYLVGKNAIKIEAKGTKFLQSNVYDNTIAQIEYPDNVHAHIFVSWLHPFKQQRLVVVGSKGMISFDDATDKKIYLYNKRIDFADGQPVKIDEGAEDIPYNTQKPLEVEMQYFIDHRGGKIDRADGQSGCEVVRTLEKVQQLLDAQG